MTVRDRVFQAAEQLSKTKPFDLITFADIAEAAGVHWSTVRRYFGGKQNMREWLKERQAEHNPHLVDTKSQVLEAAAHVFSTYGYVNSSLDKVAEYAGFSKGAVYWHFSSKQELFLSILEQNFERQLRLLSDQMERILTSDEPMTALTNWLESQFMCLEDGEEQSMLFLEFLVSGRDAEIRGKLQKLHGNLMDRIAVLIQELQQRGYMASDIDPRPMAVMLDALLKGVVVEWLLDPKAESLQALIHAISRTFLQGIGGPAKH
ncbi:TetR family transcriptional regulator [Paenibacillus sp. M1]|uniref:TetR family transcriptional regulator n=1 Tax=Paenibacillus haidiansis TaxID=1574488 RepID=A0ABU7VZX6_9BACL